MAQFMRDQSSALLGRRTVVTGSEYNVAAEGIGHRVYGMGRRSRFLIGVDPDKSEIMPETRLEERACFPIKRLAGRCKDVCQQAGRRLSKGSR